MSTTPRGKKTKITCNNIECNNVFEVRIADVKRGWGLYCSKSCKQTAQEQQRQMIKKLSGEHLLPKNKRRKKYW
ncbi:hypothetical protein RVBP17_3160 [Pseudomonas phage sp. 30-3]|uniref:Uncharacterized protein n=1 Tax=Pseudomonas phage vB_PaeM_PA5oct TaxID=2163605 RepID=A0A4Y5JUE8_9CAUD|nr:hypothetical protein PQE65_gp068 [Pseudomonas phage vB_PaeM_PA5oct]WMI31951.1 hypothetical protein GBBBJNDB_00260 [Pseudomonas phage Callisto]WPK38904.1 hypothetical protein Cassandra_0228 [Pseudomonas phage Cassandra]WPK39424.1 hypothetical protein Deiofobo_0227 [Pseudomonas phage Deifobo]WPK39937.1 hypothetical protein ETTORE_0228 [Pseudomonas phage Ettore]WPK40457.1 hypothetical protein Paride_0227 [Pseudomonas phage Paride]VOH55179.1 hypothetical protein MIJ3_00259 [Pseudomonas phage v